MNIILLNGSPVSDGATNEILDIIKNSLGDKHNVDKICLGDYQINYCLGCRKCHKTAKCVQNDDTDKIMDALKTADKIVIASPSYWADITGQLKVFFDRCTPYCNTHIPYAKLPKNKKGYAVALRTGQSTGECLHIVESINHFYGHLEIEKTANIFFCGIENKCDIEKHKQEIINFALNEIGHQ